MVQKTTKQPSPQTQLMQALIDTKDCITVRDMANNIGWAFKRTQALMEKLRLRGFAERVHRGCFRATDDARAKWTAEFEIKSGPRGKHTGQRRISTTSLQARIWNALRVVEKGTARDLFSMAANATERAKASSLETVTRYLYALRTFGYLRELDTRAVGMSTTSNGFKRYMLIQNTGPLPPTPRSRSRDLYDPNLRKAVAREVAQ